MSKRIVIGSDGTWNRPDQKDQGQTRPSNVAKLALAVAPQGADGKRQIVFYDKGVGTGFGLDRLLGGAFGTGLSKNIGDAYRYLVGHYDEGDEIFLFGFSRGAYTVRSTAGLIRNSGILRREYSNRFKEAYALYRRRDGRSHPTAIESRLFRKSYSHEVRIKFIGVWDTVGALGMPVRGLRFVNRLMGLEFHDVKLSSTVEYAYQALAIDEKRKPFRPAVWEPQPHAVGQTLEQVWFAGVHTNIGGGYVDTGLSDIALVWMIEKAETAGLAIDQAVLKELAVRPNQAGKLRNSKVGLYAMTPDYNRPIGRAAGTNESVHPAAEARYREDPTYHPKNLTEYLGRKET